jgi:hypothetical protein
MSCDFQSRTDRNYANFFNTPQIALYYFMISNKPKVSAGHQVKNDFQVSHNNFYCRKDTFENSTDKIDLVESYI